MKVLFFVICFSVVQQAWFLGTPPSKLEAKCEAYPSLSHYHKDICYIVDKRSKCLKKDAKDSLCSHLHFFNGQIAKYDEKVEFELKTVGLLKDGYPAFFKDRIFQGEDNNKTNGPVVCAYTDDFYCPEGYQLLGVHCYKIFTDASCMPMLKKHAKKIMAAWLWCIPIGLCSFWRPLLMRQKSVTKKETTCSTLDWPVTKRVHSKMPTIPMLTTSDGSRLEME